MKLKNIVLNLLRRFNKKLSHRFAKRKIASKQKSLETMTSTQKRAIDVVFELLKDEENDLLIAPLSNKYYLKNDKINMLVTLISSSNSGGFVNIINGKFHYDIWLDSFAFQYMLDRFMKVIDRRRNKMEGEIRAKVDESLETIYQNLKDEHEIKIEKPNKTKNSKTKKDVNNESTSSKTSDTNK
jgi:hypothetical protein